MLASGAGDDGALEEVFFDRDLDGVVGVEVLEALGELVGVVEDVLDRSRHEGSPDELGSCRHGVDDEVDSLAGADADLEESACEVGSDQHGEVVEYEHADRVVVGVDDVVVCDAVFASARKNDRIHAIKLS